MKTLFLEKRGCDFWRDDNINTFSDVGNYRVGCYKNLIKGKNGRNYILEFTQSTAYVWRTTNKRTGAPLQKPIRELKKRYCLRLDSEFDETRNGSLMSFADLKLEEKINNLDLTYTLKNILYVVNLISVERYDKIEFLK